MIIIIAANVLGVTPKFAFSEGKNQFWRPVLLQFKILNMQQSLCDENETSFAKISHLPDTNG